MLLFLLKRKYIYQKKLFSKFIIFKNLYNFKEEDQEDKNLYYVSGGCITIYMKSTFTNLKDLEVLYKYTSIYI